MRRVLLGSEIYKGEKLRARESKLPAQGHMDGKQGSQNSHIWDDMQFMRV